LSQVQQTVSIFHTDGQSFEEAYGAPNVPFAFY